MATFSIANANEQNAFKRTYAKLSDTVYNSRNHTTSQIKKNNELKGTSKFVYLPLSFSGGVGSGTLPTAGIRDYAQAQISAKKVYARVNIDRETIKAGEDDVGSFIRSLKHQIESAVESFARNDSRIFFGQGDGSLGTIAAGGVSGTNPYVCTFAAGYNLANFEEKDLVNIETGNTDPFLVDLVDEQSDGTLDVTVTRQSGSQVPAATDEFFMQGSEDNDPNGLGNVTDATSSTLYGVTVARRWQSTQVDASSATLTTDLMNQTMLTIEKNCNTAPNMIVTSYAQYQKLLELLEDRKEYTLEPRYVPKSLKATLGFSGIQYMSTMGPIPIIQERFCPDDRMYFLNKDQIIRYHRPGGISWFRDDGSIWLREVDSDTYEARYGGYYDNFIVPTFQGRIDALTT